MLLVTVEDINIPKRAKSGSAAAQENGVEIQIKLSEEWDQA